MSLVRQRCAPDCVPDTTVWICDARHHRQFFLAVDVDVGEGDVAAKMEESDHRHSLHFRQKPKVTVIVDTWPVEPEVERSTLR